MTTKKSSLLNDLIADAQEALPTNDALTSVSALALRLVGKLGERAAMEEQLKELSEEIRQLEQQDLPDAMTEAGNLTFMRLHSGAEISLKAFVEASLPREDPEKRAAALDWLFKNHPDIVKHEVKMSFTKGEDKRATRAMQLLQKAGFDNVVDDTTVHHATLKAFVRDQVEKGRAIPLDLFQAHVGEKATVKLPKEGK